MNKSNIFIEDRITGRRIYVDRAGAIYKPVKLTNYQKFKKWVKNLGIKKSND